MAWRRYVIKRAERCESASGLWKLEIDGAAMLFGSERQVRKIAAEVASEQWLVFRRAGVVAIDDGHGERTLESHGSISEADAHAQRDTRPLTELYVGRGEAEADAEAAWKICSDGRTLKAFNTRSAAMEHARYLIGSLWRAQAPAAIYVEDLAGQFRLDATLGRARGDLPELKCGGNFAC